MNKETERMIKEANHLIEIKDLVSQLISSSILLSSRMTYNRGKQITLDEAENLAKTFVEDHIESVVK